MTTRTCAIEACPDTSVHSDGRTTPTPSPLARLGAWITAMLDAAWLRAEKRRQMRMLAALDDRSLSDIGLSRGDVFLAERHDPRDLVRHPDIYGR